MGRYRSKFKYSNYKMQQASKNPKDPMCPTCGRTTVYTRIGNAYNHHGRALVNPSWSYFYGRYIGSRRSRQERPTVRIRLSKKVAKIDNKGRKTYVVCADPFHDYIHPDDLPKSNPPIPPKVHHPDLTKNKKILKRDLQGKDRR